MPAFIPPCPEQSHFFLLSELPEGTISVIKWGSAVHSVSIYTESSLGIPSLDLPRRQSQGVSIDSVQLTGLFIHFIPSSCLNYLALKPVHGLEYLLTAEMDIKKKKKGS